MSVARPEIMVPVSTMPKMEVARWRSHAAGLTNHVTEAVVEFVERVALAPFSLMMGLFVRLLRI